MIDPNDKNTLPLLPPSTKEKTISKARKKIAKTAAQRKADQRARDGWKAVNASTKNNYSSLTQTGLIEQLSYAVTAKNKEIAKAIAAELVKRATPSKK